VLALPLALSGCSSPTRPPEPPAGGRTPQLSFEQFLASVEPVLSGRGCDAGGDCHGGGIRGSFRLSPPDAKDQAFDFDQAVLQVSAHAPESSALLTEPLAVESGGTPHPAKPFASAADPGYQAIRQWVLDGVQP
jgi:hypothetical protein